MPTQKNSASWDLQLGFSLAFKRLMVSIDFVLRTCAQSTVVKV